MKCLFVILYWMNKCKAYSMQLLAYHFKEGLISGRIKFYYVFLACLILSFLNSFFFAFIADHYFPEADLLNNPIDKESVPEQLLVACIFAPLLETWLFISLPNHLMNKFGIKSLYLLIIIPALLFGVNHYYNPLYMIAMFFSGVLMSFLYIYCKWINTGRQAFLYVVLLHALYNLYAVLARYL